jgi:tetratricopeptide (TPR) repeat protein
LSNLEKDFENKKNMLEEAISDQERALQLCIKESSQFERRGDLLFSGALGFSQYSYGMSLNRLYGLTNSNEHQRKAIKAFEEAAESYQKLNLLSRIAECWWKTAAGYDALGDHLDAAKNFALASNNYKNAAEKIPQLKSFYQDRALYMQAWSEIEKARHYHDRQEYGLAKEHFQKAAELHRLLKQWGYLEPNYRAWAQVEKAEELSRSEQSEEAIGAFEQAARLFSETKKSLQTQLSKIEDADEKQMATSMIKASGLRHEYCDARIAIEEARILDKKGEHFVSSEKYGSAAETFEKIGQTLESEQERKEFRFIINLSRAWQKMMLADAKASPELYLEASTLFEQASKGSSNEMTGLLALGHSRFCRALEVGTRFADTGNATLHTVAVQHLESAAKYYAKAGFQSASEYAKATGLLFDAYVHMDNAKKEEDPERKAKLYTIAEKVLQTSAGFYMKAEHPEKREQVTRLLDKVREERELAVSIAEVLHAPSVISATTSFIAPTPTSEEAVGSERFEHADVQANLIVRQKELKIGENLNIGLELVNAGKGFALLTKVTEIIPKGFELADEPETCRVEDSYINLKGKRLDPLKTEELKLILKPTVQGTFSLKPTVLYLDENGKYKSHEPEPVIIIVKELGIKSWLKGER